MRPKPMTPTVLSSSSMPPYWLRFHAPPLSASLAGAMLRAAPAALVLQGKHAGARPAARAVLDPRIAGGELWGPRVFGLRGRPHRERLWAQLEEAGTARRLWDASAELTGVDPAAGCTSRCGS